MKNTNLVLKPTPNYELLDSGNGRKLERFGKYTLIRRESQAMWNVQNPELWNTADCEYIRTSDKGGEWKTNNKDMPQEWEYNYDVLKMKIKLTPFGHVGVFPEQGLQWDFIAKACHLKQNAEVLSLFSYTGGATLAAARVDAHVTHVDASKPALSWAVENQKLSDMDNKHVRWIVDDALKFIKREERRGKKYDGIIMDPPKFGRGPKGEVWQFEKDFPELLECASKIISNNPLFFLVTAYTVPISSITLGNMLQDIMPKTGTLEHGDLSIEDKNERLLPTSIYSRWLKD